MRTICFRRTSDLLQLPPSSTEEILIELTYEEQNLYKDILSEAKSEYDEILNMRSTKKKYCVLFAATMKLRRLCNHGTFKPNETDQQFLTPSIPNKKRSRRKQIYIEDGSEELPCAYCNADNADLDDSLELCPECSRVFDTRTQATSPSSSNSPYLSTVPDRESLSPGWTSSNMGQSTQRAMSPLTVESRYSTKLNAVVSKIEGSPPGSKQYVYFAPYSIHAPYVRACVYVKIRKLKPNDHTASFSPRGDTPWIFYKAYYAIEASTV